MWGTEARIREIGARLFAFPMTQLDDMIGTVAHGRFAFECPVEVFSKADGNTSKERRIGGICSTDDIDRQAEQILQDGLDFKPFLTSGWFNDNHDPSTDALVGYPTDAEYRQLGMRKGWYVEGFLLKGSPRADALWMLAKALQETESRRLGFSVEGAILSRDEKKPTIIKKAVVREVAITRCPVNTATALHVLAKSLSAGNAVPVPKTPVTGDGAGRVISPQSIEAKKNTPPDILAKLKKRRKGRALTDAEKKLLDKASRGEPITRSEVVVLLRTMVPHLSERTATEIADYHFATRAA